MCSLKLSFQKSPYNENKDSNIYRHIRDHVALMWDILTKHNYLIENGSPSDDQEVYQEK